MNKFIVAVFVSVIAGALADYGAPPPPKYEAPKGGYESSGGYGAPAKGGYESSGGYAAPAKYEAPKGYAAPPKYEAPKGYAAPAPKGGYGGGGGYAPVVHTYAAKAPSVKCGASLLVGCAPSISKVPCIPSKGGYGGGSKGGYGGGKGGYRAHMEHEEEADEFEE
ncbi:vitelline membrane protein 15a-2-like [Toxorhynchites rutilus septentrionalis]|uniref:vitelline membrane protein 15a-2-like n=1 Tax=Toxorhynchites rutilus septentrionalis TaxID=329112 RepID=UPI00247842A7|nr:vitelline membrane protein 15a-2-like [Toxorhynchites rutilus septentrionalis]